MAIDRIFYVTQDSLCIWSYNKGRPRVVATFLDDDNGLQEFDSYLAGCADDKSAMLVDVIEEEFAVESIPSLGMRDRNSLVQRRAQRKFRRTPYRVSLLQSKADSGSGEHSVMHSAIVNHELLDRWLQIILSHCTPLVGVYSIPHLARQVVEKLLPDSGSMMFIAPHQHNKLRQVFLRDKTLHSARLSRSPGVDDPTYAQVVVSEADRSRRYLERARLLSHMEVMDFCVIADEKAAAKIDELTSASDNMRFTFIDPLRAASMLGSHPLTHLDCFEEIYVSLLARRRPAKSYATSGENSYWHMQRLRSAVVNGAVTGAAICSVAAGVLLSDTWLVNRQSVAIDAQVEQLAETFRREHERVDPIKADSHEMKLAVDSGNYILENRVPVPWVMNQLGVVMGNYPTIQADELRWVVETPVVENERRQRPGEAPLPVPIPEITAVSADLTATIFPFNGDMRSAFSLIDQLAAELRDRTHFTTAAVIEYPIDANTASSVSGEFIGDRTHESVSFRVRVSYELHVDADEDHDDAI